MLRWSIDAFGTVLYTASGGGVGSDLQPTARNEPDVERSSRGSATRPVRWIAAMPKGRSSSSKSSSLVG